MGLEGAMKNFWTRAGLVAGVVLAFGSGAWTPAVDIVKKDTTSCKKLQYYCDRTCEESPYPGTGVCQEGKNGATSAISVECCCCTEGSEHRYFIGG